MVITWSEVDKMIYLEVYVHCSAPQHHMGRFFKICSLKCSLVLTNMLLVWSCSFIFCVQQRHGIMHEGSVG